MPRYHLESCLGLFLRTHAIQIPYGCRMLAIHFPPSLPTGLDEAINLSAQRPSHGHQFTTFNVELGSLIARSSSQSDPGPFRPKMNTLFSRVAYCFPRTPSSSVKRLADTYHHMTFAPNSLRPARRDPLISLTRASQGDLSGSTTL